MDAYFDWIYGYTEDFIDAKKEGATGLSANVRKNTRIDGDSVFSKEKYHFVGTI
jgi:hypothetical protein